MYERPTSSKPEDSFNQDKVSTAIDFLIQKYQNELQLDDHQMSLYDALRNEISQMLRPFDQHNKESSNSICPILVKNSLKDLAEMKEANF